MADLSTVFLSWSGGKDSTAAFILHQQSLHFVKAVIYIPMFTDDIPLIRKKHFDFVNEASEYFRENGAEVTFANGITYYNQVTRLATRGKFKGKCIGFPFASRSICHFKRDSKLKALNSVDIGYYDYKDIGIAYDEPKRFVNLNPESGVRSILVERKITESDARKLCESHGLLSPQYEDGQLRDGCVLCPFSKDRERAEWFKDYPQAIPIVKEIQEIVKKDKPEQRPLIGNKWFL